MSQCHRYGIMILVFDKFIVSMNKIALAAKCILNNNNATIIQIILHDTLFDVIYRAKLQ